MADVKSELKVNEIVEKTLDNLAQSSANTMTQAGADQVKVDVKKELTAVVTNQLNQEPWWASTVTLGSILTLVSSGYNIAYVIITTGPPTPADFTVLVAPFGGALIALYGRWIQSKALWGQ